MTAPCGDPHPAKSRTDTLPADEQAETQPVQDLDVRVVEGIARIDDLDAFLDTIRGIRDETGAVVQVFDARYVVSRNHLVRAVKLAERALERGEAVARDRAVEVLLYAAGRRQIDRALAMGVDEGTTPAVAVIYAPPGCSGGAGQRAGHADGGSRDSGRDSTDKRETTVSTGDANTDGQTDTGVEARTDAESSVGVEACTDVDTAVERVRDLLSESHLVGPGSPISATDPESVREFFDITEPELDTVDGDLTDLVLERVALLDVEK